MTVSEEWRMLYNEKLCELYNSSSISRKWIKEVMGHVAQMKKQEIYTEL